MQLAPVYPAPFLFGQMTRGPTCGQPPRRSVRLCNRNLWVRMFLVYIAQVPRRDLLGVIAWQLALGTGAPRNTRLGKVTDALPQ